MAREIPRQQQKKLLRLISARSDMNYAQIAFARIKRAIDDEDRYCHFLAFVVSYCRPFTENHGLGNLAMEFSNYPADLDLDEGNLRHGRMIDLRNKFLSHSSLEGTKVVLLSPGAVDPGTGTTVVNYGWNVARREFLDERFADWLVEIVNALAAKLDEMISVLVRQIGERNLDPAEIRYLETLSDEFEQKWLEERA